MGNLSKIFIFISYCLFNCKVVCRNFGILLFARCMDKCWVVKVTEESRLHVTKMQILRWICVTTIMDKIRNKYIRGSLKGESTSDGKGKE